MFTMITERHNYDNGYIALVNIELENAPDKITVNGDELLKKSEFHVSIMAIKNLAPLLEPDSAEKASELLKQDFLDFAATKDLTSLTLTAKYRLVTRDERATIVAMVDLKGVEGLFQYLRQRHNVDFPTQPTHITLYTLQPEAGIGILSQEQLETSSIPIEVPELASLKIQ